MAVAHVPEQFLEVADGSRWGDFLRGL